MKHPAFRVKIIIPHRPPLDQYGGELHGRSVLCRRLTVCVQHAGVVGGGARDSVHAAVAEEGLMPEPGYARKSPAICISATCTAWRRPGAESSTAPPGASLARATGMQCTAATAGQAARKPHPAPRPPHMPWPPAEGGGHPNQVVCHLLYSPPFSRARNIFPNRVNDLKWFYRYLNHVPRRT